MSHNASELESFIEDQPVGKTLVIATSQYADREVPASTFDYWSTAPAVRSLIKRGILEGESQWRCYVVRRIA